MEKFIIDTDPGIDDAQAILMAAAHPNVDITAITVVGGNVGLRHTVRNALTLAEIVNQPIPVYPGCDRPFVLPGENAAFAHGNDGLGDVGLRPRARRAETEHAVLALIRLVTESPGEYTLVALGPLTNIAVALKLDPGLPNKIKRFVDMGGAVTGRGNSSNITAEFNIFADPEAAHVVFEGWSRAGKLIEVIDWEATLRHGISADIVKDWLAMQTPKAKFLQQITVKSMIASKKRRKGDDTFYSADPLAMTVALEPECVLEAEEHYLAVEISGQFGRGQTVVDWQDRSQRNPNASIVLRIDTTRFQTLMAQGLQ